MGRPLKKSLFGTGAGNQFKVRAKIGSAAEGDGFIVKQTGSKRFVVKVGSDTGVCYLVDKVEGTLAAGDMTIALKDADDNVKNAVKIKAHMATFGDGTASAWSFAAASEGVMEAEEVDTDDFTPEEEV
jgi:hypothetical protein